MAGRSTDSFWGRLVNKIVLSILNRCLQDVFAKAGGLNIFNRQGCRVIRLEPNLECGVQEATIEHLHAIKGRTFRNSVEFFLKRTYLILDSLSVLPCIDAVCRLNRQLTHPVQDLCHLFNCTFCRLCQRDGIRSISYRCFQTFNLGCHPVDNRRTSCIVYRMIQT